MKTCSLCGELKAAADYCRNAHGKMGLHSQCRDCRKKRSQALRIADPESVRLRTRIYQRENRERCRAYNAKHRRALRAAALTAYGGDPPRCACCQESKQGFLTIDHVDGGGSAQKREIGSKLYSWLKQQGYPPGYRVLCFNCNCAIGAYGVCPHVDPTAGTLNQEIDKQPSEEYRRVMKEAIEVVAAKEGLQPLDPTLF